MIPKCITTGIMAKIRGTMIEKAAPTDAMMGV
jgi:hypothetical protein